MGYVDTGPASGALMPDFEGDEKLPPSREELEQSENLDGLSDEQLATFQRRAVPEPGAALREGAELKNDARLDVPSTVICTGNTSDEYKAGVEEGWSFLAGLAELRVVTWIDLPTSPWPMWARQHELAAIIGDIAPGGAAGSRSK